LLELKQEICTRRLPKEAILMINIFLIAAPSQAPSDLSVTAKSSTSITASWQLPPADSRNGIIKGFKLFYKKKVSSGSPSVQRINSESTRTKVVTGLAKYTEYEFQVLAFTSKGDGPKSNPKSATTKEDGKKSELTIAYTSVYCYARPCQLSKILINPKNL
jgi:protein sidekick